MFSQRQRKEIVEKYTHELIRTFPDSSQYNVFIFGSFLTEKYTEDSDIDIGIFSAQAGLTFRLYSFTKEYFECLGIRNDVVRMHLSYSQYINLAIILNNTFAATDYCPPELIHYTQEMLERFGANPQKTMLDMKRKEMVSA